MPQPEGPTNTRSRRRDDQAEAVDRSGLLAGVLLVTFLEPDLAPLMEPLAAEVLEPVEEVWRSCPDSLRDGGSAQGEQRRSKTRAMTTTPSVAVRA